MKPEEIDNLEPGRELDALIANCIMQWRVTEACGVYGVWFGSDVAQLPYFSTEIKAAWQVVEKLRELQFTHLDLRFHNHSWGMVGYHNLSDDSCRPTTWAPTAPLAICRAALKAVTHQSD